MKRSLTVVVLLLTVALVLTGCGRRTTPTPPPLSDDLPANAMTVAQERGLTPDDIYAALKTYTPSGKHDDYYIFASGGHSGNLIVIGIPSMRILKQVAVFTPESWQGYGTGELGSEEVLDGGNVDGVKIRTGDTHHPALSETAGDYDGQYVFINDKANARVAVIDLRDFETKQIVKDPNIISNHGSTFVTPNTEYVIQGTQYATPLGWEYAPISEYQEKYRGLITLWAFDREKGRIDMEKSFSIEVPPYWQDLCDAGKLVSDGWAFCNSFNGEMYTGGIEKGNPPFEAGVSQGDMDYLHIFNWKKAAQVAEQAGKSEMINGMRVIRIPTAVEEGILYLAPEPKSPHGADVTPDGKYVVVAGKLDPHITIYAVDKIEAAIAAKNWELDPFGIPVLNFDAVKHAQIELGLGPLHSIFDNQGFGYTSLFLDSAVAKWKVGGDNPADWVLVDKLPVQYNIGHLTAAEGDTVSPDGDYVLVLNKWSVDRFLPVGPLLPQNLQLIDISNGNFKVIYDMPMGIGEPHNAQIIKADKIKAWNAYPQVGWDPIAQAPSPYATQLGEERIDRNGNEVEVFMTSIRSHLTPEHVEIKKGDHVTWHITNVETAHDAVHGFQLGGQSISLSIEPGETASFEFTAEHDGTYAFYCTEFCSALHLEMMGYMFVEP